MKKKQLVTVGALGLLGWYLYNQSKQAAAKVQAAAAAQAAAAQAATNPLQGS